MFIMFNPGILLTEAYAKETTKKCIRMDIKRCSAVIFIIVEKLGTG